METTIPQAVAAGRLRALRTGRRPIAGIIRAAHAYRPCHATATPPESNDPRSPRPGHLSMSSAIGYKLLAIMLIVGFGYLVGRLRWLGSAEAEPARVLSNAAFFMF